MLSRHRRAAHHVVNLSRSTLNPLLVLRYYLHTRPGARRALASTLSVGGASWISLSLATPVKIERGASSMAATQDEEEMRGRTQQAPLASQRAREQGQEQQGRVAKWFPLGAKEGFTQWVSWTVALCCGGGRMC